MANANKGAGSKPTGSRARSVGAAGHMNPVGAILDDADFIMKRRRSNFDMWKATRSPKQTRNADVEAWFRPDEHPLRGK